MTCFKERIYSKQNLFALVSRHGDGKLTTPDGYLYDGEWKKNEKFGFAEIVYSNNSVYEGSIKNGNHHGKGKLTFADGLVIDGDWKDGEINGSVKILQPNGDIYQGEMIKGKRSGKGKTTYASGDTFEGFFSDDKRNGFGVFDITFSNAISELSIMNFALSSNPRISPGH